MTPAAQDSALVALQPFLESLSTGGKTFFIFLRQLESDDRLIDVLGNFTQGLLTQINKTSLKIYLHIKRVIDFIWLFAVSGG